MNEFEKWLETRPQCVKDLAKEFPLGTVFQVEDGSRIYLLGYTEDDQLIVSPIDPSENYKQSHFWRKNMCAKHFRESVIYIQ